MDDFEHGSLRGRARSASTSEKTKPRVYVCDRRDKNARDITRFAVLRTVNRISRGRIGSSRVCWTETVLTILIINPLFPNFIQNFSHWSKKFFFQMHIFNLYRVFHDLNWNFFEEFHCDVVWSQ